MSHNKPSVLEGADPAKDQVPGEETDAGSARPCRLLTPEGGKPLGGLPEDESADPVGDGHSDADFADRSNPPKP